jgi:hypothetical protein
MPEFRVHLRPREGFTPTEDRMLQQFRLAMSNRLRTAQQGISLITVCTLMMAAAPAARADFYSPWTTVGSDGTPDEATAAHVQYSGSYALLSAAAPIPTTVFMRYNVVAVDGLLVGGDGYLLKVRFADAGSHARVYIRLMEYSLTTGASSVRMVFDSNSYPSSGVTQVRSVPACWPSWAFDFNNKAYYFEAQLIKSAAGSSPILAGISIGRTLC